jgi:hypothetical protein
MAALAAQGALSMQGARVAPRDVGNVVTILAAMVVLAVQGALAAQETPVGQTS